MALADVRSFITQAQKYAMPTAFLTRLVNDYDFDFETGSGNAHVSYTPWHHELVLYENTWKGLARPDFADVVSVQTLYHEGTHAFIDLTDYDETTEFGEAMKYYEWAKLNTDNRAYVWPDVETERAVQEAAACYVGHRASTVWRTWWRVRFIDQLIQGVAANKMTATRAVEIMQNAGKSTVANEYWATITEQNFGYIERDDKQISIEKPIFWKLANWCDKNILENKIADDIIHMPDLGKYLTTVYEAAKKYPEIKKAMETP